MRLSTKANEMTQHSKSIIKVSQLTSLLRRSRIAISLVILLLVVANVSVAQSPTRIRIPTMGVDADIVPVYIRQFPEGHSTWDVSGLHMNAGLFQGLGSVLGQFGNTVVGAHSEATDGSPDLFFSLDAISLGTDIFVDTNGQTLVYRVTDVYSVAYNNLRPLYPTSDERLTLITCDVGSYNGSNGAYSRRVIVVAVRIQ